jgi:hypothetical protein
MSDAAASVGARGFATSARRQVTLVPSILVVEAIEEDRLLFLEVRSRVDPTQALLLAVSHRPVLAGIASFTALGRVHAMCWALAFGVGNLPEGAQVRFESGTLRHARTAVSAVHRMAHQCWVADAEGVFTRVALVIGGEERACARLAAGQ